MSANLRYLEPAAEKFARWKGSLEQRLDWLSVDEMHEIAESYNRILAAGHQELIGKHLSSSSDEPFCRRILGLVHAFDLLAKRGVEPFASGGPAVRWPSRVRPLSLLRAGAICEARRDQPATCEIDSDHEGFPFVLCRSAAERLESHALTPREWFNLAGKHTGDDTALDYRWYDYNGIAIDPGGSISCDGDAEEFPCIVDAEGDPRYLLNYAIAWHADAWEDVWVQAADRLRCCDAGALMDEIIRRASVALPPPVEDALCRVCAECFGGPNSLGGAVGKWVGDRWKQSLVPTNWMYRALKECVATSDRVALIKARAALESSGSPYVAVNALWTVVAEMEAEDAFDLAVMAIERLPQWDQARNARLQLASIQTTRALAWVERRADDIISSSLSINDNPVGDDYQESIARQSLSSSPEENAEASLYDLACVVLWQCNGDLSVLEAWLKKRGVVGAVAARAIVLLLGNGNDRFRDLGVDIPLISVPSRLHACLQEYARASGDKHVRRWLEGRM